jgi:hypothetical protein
MLLLSVVYKTRESLVNWWLCKVCDVTSEPLQCEAGLPVVFTVIGWRNKSIEKKMAQSIKKIA